MMPMIAAVPPIKTLSLETDPRRSTPSRRLELPVSLSDIVPPSLNRGSPHPTARVFSSGRFGHGLPPSPSLAIITSPGCPGLRSRPLARLCYLFYRHSSTVRKQGRNSVVSYLTPITGLPPAVSPGRR